MFKKVAAIIVLLILASFLVAGCTVNIINSSQLLPTFVDKYQSEKKPIVEQQRQNFTMREWYTTWVSPERWRLTVKTEYAWGNQSNENESKYAQFEVDTTNITRFPSVDAASKRVDEYLSLNYSDNTSKSWTIWESRDISKAGDYYTRAYKNTTGHNPTTVKAFYREDDTQGMERHAYWLIQMDTLVITEDMHTRVLLIDSRDVSPDQQK